MTYERTKQQRIKNIENKTFHCQDCDKVFKDSYDLKNHLAKTKKHNKHLYVKYECSQCNYTTKFKPVMAKHLETKRHLKKSSPPPPPPPELL
jgi:uncharacterized C2H2 Zn-finger protein